MNKNIAVDPMDAMPYHGKFIIKDRKGKSIFARTPGQDRLLDAIENNDIIFVNGPSGTGKTAIATWVGINGMDNGVYQRLVLTRPVVSGGEELGFLPGTMDEKIAPYMQPLYDSISMIKGRREDRAEEKKEDESILLTAKEKRRLRAERKESRPEPKPVNFYDQIQVCPLAYIRGSTLAHSFIVCDEFQNTTSTQMKTMLTRLGHGSKMVICGDREQCDLVLRHGAQSGFSEAFHLLKGVKRIAFVELGVEDIVRHRLIKDIILRYERPAEARMASETPEGEAKSYVYGTHTPGWSPDEDGYDFSEDDIEEDADEEPKNFDEDNAKFADEWRRNHFED